MKIAKILAPQFLVLFVFTASTMEKKIQKMKSKYQKEGKSILRDLGADFKFTKAVGY